MISEKRARCAGTRANEVRGISKIQGLRENAAAASGSEINSIRSIITSSPSSDKMREEVFACLNRLEERIDLLEAQMKRHFGNSKLVEAEIGRLVSNKWESLSKETDECLTRVMGEMQDLRDTVIGMRNSVRAMEK